MKSLFTIIISILFFTPCFSQQDLLPVYPREITYSGEFAYYNGTPFTGLLVEEKTNKKLGEFKNGYKHGLFTEYYINGLKKNECNYSMGIKEGTYSEWYENGQKKLSYTYNYGNIADGKYILYLENGLEDKEETYKGGQKINESNYNDKESLTQTKDNNNEMILREMLTIVKMQSQQDSLLRIELRKMQEQIVKQNEQNDKTLTEISDLKTKNDTTYKGVLRKIQTNGDELKTQIDDAVKAVNKMNTTVQDVENSRNEKWKPKPIGIGVDVAGVLFENNNSNSTTSSYQYYSPNVIFLSFDPIANFRIETESAITFSKGSSSIYYVAGGLFGMWQSGKSNFYAGIKAMRFTDVDITLITPTIGGEYVFGNHFSFGSEIGFPFAVANKDASMGFGFNRFILRYYF